MFVSLDTGEDSLAPTPSFAAGIAPTSQATGDLNGSGDPDLAVANRDGDAVTVLLNHRIPWDLRNYGLPITN